MSQKITFTDVSSFIPKSATSEDTAFDSLVILEFSLKVPPPATQWILDKIRLLKSKGGSELLVCPIMDENHEVIFSVCSVVSLIWADQSVVQIRVSDTV